MGRGPGHALEKKTFSFWLAGVSAVRHVCSRSRGAQTARGPSQCSSHSWSGGQRQPSPAPLPCAGPRDPGPQHDTGRPLLCPGASERYLQQPLQSTLAPVEVVSQAGGHDTRL